MPGLWNLKDKRSRRAAYRFGVGAELLCCVLLWMKGYQIIGVRERTPFGEIDIIARRGGIMCFIEVKGRQEESAAYDSVTSEKRMRIQRASEVFCASSPKFAGLERRFDLIIVSDWHWPKHLQDAWRA